MQNPNRVGGRRLPSQHHDQQNNSPHAETDPHNNHKIREMEKEKQKKKRNQRGNGGRKSEKRILMARNEIERREWEDLMGEKKRIFVERKRILKGKSRVNGH